MLSLAAPVRPLITNLGRFINMSSQALGLQGSRTQDLEDCVSQCCKASFVRTVCSCARTSDEKITDETQDGKLAKNEVLQWCNLSHNEKKIYFAHKHACLNDENSYIDPITGYAVFTEEFLRRHKTCCGNGCRHCPYGQENVPEERKKKFNTAFYV